MQKRRFGFTAAGLFVVASMWATPTLADMFYYRDTQGQLHLTNVWSRIPETHRDQASRNRRPEQGGHTQDMVATQMPSTPQAREDNKRDIRSATASPHATPVDTRAFGLLNLRMSDFEVAQRLGPPAAISDVGQRILAPTGGSSQVIRVVRGDETWYYPGTTRIPATRLEFQRGILVKKMRVHH